MRRPKDMSIEEIRKEIEKLKALIHNAELDIESQKRRKLELINELTNRKK